MGAYPYADWNFYYTTLSATGEDLSGVLWHNALMVNYLLWNYLPAADAPRHFGYGDSHQRDGLRIQPITHRHVYTHLNVLENIFGNAFGTRYPLETVQAADHVRALIPEEHRQWSDIYFIYPFLAPATPPASRLGRGTLDFTRLPKARHFERMGQTMMASGFEPEDVFFLFAAGGTMDAHQHYDALHFTIFSRGGHLALDSGDRRNNQRDKSHLLNYYSQTVAHNSILVHQPGEPGNVFWGSRGIVYGGQHGRGSEVVAFETGDHFSYVAADASRAYLHGVSELGEKVESVTRQVVFVHPAHFVIFDRVISTDPGYRKEWLLHTVQEPVLAGTTFMADQGDGRLWGQTLLPHAAHVTKLGGPGKEFWVAGRNWPLPGGDEVASDDLELAGHWRIEVSPATPTREDWFLHVLEVSDQTRLSPSPAVLLETDDTYGVQIRTEGTIWRVDFQKHGVLSGGITARGDITLEQSLTPEVQPQAGIYNQPRMTIEEAVRRIPKRSLPEFWGADLKAIERCVAGLKVGEHAVLTTSPGGRPIHVVTFGAREVLPRLANFNSAIGAREPEVFSARRLREKPVLFLLGPVHGQEPEGLVGLLNLINIMETGRDLRGREHATLRDKGQRCRLVIVPHANPDGLARFAPRTLHGMTADDMRFWGQGTWKDDTIRVWPEGKRQHPMRAENCGFLGTYYNDAGINLMHDDFFLPQSEEVPAVLARVRAEAPDLAVSLHSAGGGPAVVCAAYVPDEIASSIQLLASAYDQRVLRRFNVPRPTFRPGFEQGTKAFNLTSALYHASGAAAFTFESPTGIQRPDFPALSLDELLDMQLVLYETMLDYLVAQQRGTAVVSDE